MSACEQKKKDQTTVKTGQLYHMSGSCVVMLKTPLKTIFLINGLL